VSYTILIVDDDPDIVRLLEQDMKDEGYAVVTGHDGQMALSLAQSRRPNLMILDVQMPMTNGLKVLEFIRKLPETKDIPILFLSGARSDMVYPAIANAPRVAFIKKPIDLEEINTMVRQLLEKYRT
jgi:DNA-binding response OmpR family regulator